jgi:hypothetical protein
MERLVVRHRDGSVELAKGHSVEEALLRLVEYESTRLPPEDLGEVEENAYDLGYQAALRHKGITWGEAAELQQYRSLGSLENLQQLVKERRRKSGAQED